ncbi:MAG: Tll0287-like domain-containing protein [Pseudomonadota bacterium]
MRTPLLPPLVLVCLATAAFAAATMPAQPSEPPVDETAQAIRRAETATADLGRSLREALMAEMATGGPVGAIDFCHDKAPGIADAVAARHGVKIGRVGVRVRSPANVAGDWQRAMLEDFSRRAAAGEAPQALQFTKTDSGTGVLRHARGIRTEPACLLCHGPAVAAPVQSAIRARYPQDAATGFEEGSLRGAFWVEVPLSRTASATVPPATAASVDHRIAIALSPTHAAALREEMRGQLMTLQGIIGGLATQDWKAIETLADARGPGKGGGRGQGFRAQLPVAWFDVARPMHTEYAAIAEEARSGRRVDAALRTLEAVTAQCTACHATYRIEERTTAP